MKVLPVLFAILSVSCSYFASAVDFEQIERSLDFEPESPDVSFSQLKKGGWRCYPTGCVTLDREVFNTGETSARIENEADDIEEVVVFRDLPFSFEAERLNFKISICADEDMEAYIDVVFLDVSGKTLIYREGERFTLKPGGWTVKTYESEVPEDCKAVRLLIHSVSDGVFWADSIEVTGDGKAMKELPLKTTILDRDHEFDEGSGIAPFEGTSLQIAALEKVGLIWGFLKYHHPAVKRGEFHWDYELFRVLPKVVNYSSEESLQQALFEWVEGFDLPELEPVAEVGEKEVDLHFAADLGWLKDSKFLRADTRDVLERIYRSRNSEKKSFYFTLKHDSYPNFIHELSYPEMDVQDVGYRLLALFRYWNMVQYWFPYRNLIPTDWQEVLHQSIPEFLSANDEQAYKRALAVLIAQVNDSHANYMHRAIPYDKGTYRLNAVFERIENQWVVTAYEDENQPRDFQIGDVVISIDGVDTEKTARNLQPFCGASNQAVLNRNIGRNLLPVGAQGEAEVKVLRSGNEVELRARRIEMKGWPGKHIHSRLNGVTEFIHSDVLYLNMAEVKAEEVDSYVDAIMNAKGVVIDIRNYPSAHLVHTLAGHFLTEDTEFALFTIADMENPGYFVYGPTDTVPVQEPYFPGKVIVLVDELSQSNSEYQTMAFGAGKNTVVIGSQTAGADGNISYINLPGVPGTTFSGIGVFYPDKTPTQRIGIVPDIEARPTIEGIKAGRDELLEVALKEILGDSVSDDELKQLAMRN